MAALRGWEPGRLYLWGAALRSMRYHVAMAYFESDIARRASGAMTDEAVVRTMWSQFQKFAPPETTVVDTTGQDVDGTVAALQAGLAAGRFKLG